MPWLAFGYPILAHLGVSFHSLHLQWLALLWLLVISLWGALAQRRGWAWSVLTIGAVTLYVLTMSGNGMYVLYLPPILIPLALLLLFARSLRGGEIPIVTRIAESMRGEQLPDVLRVYTRSVTQLWCCVSTALLFSAVGTAIWASPEVWSLMTNLIHYVVLGAVFILEFLYRQKKYGRLEQWGLMQYLRRLAHTKIRM